MFYIIIGTVLIIIYSLFSVLTGRRIKALFGIPFYYRTVATDLYGQKGRFVKHRNVVGKPDAIFKHLFLPKYIVGELKSRSCHGAISKYERYQTTLYMGMLKKSLFFGQVSGRVGYKNGFKSLTFDKHCFNWLMSLRHEVKKINKTHRLNV